MFQSVPASVNFPELEARILRFWEEQRIYEKSLEQRRGAQPFVFFEGPPTANGMPHPGHCLTRAIKDLFPRYRTMRGQFCERKAGWDTHGLPVETEVCKELGIHSKEEIEAYGIEPFIQKCQQSVWRYMQEWERLTQRLGFWIHLDEAYVTYHQSYVESVWWALKNFFDRGLLYQGHKIVWWWAQGGTTLSSGEVGLGYREVADPSVFVLFPIIENDKANALELGAASLLVWTTTPWTLPSNQFVAVDRHGDYVVVRDNSTNMQFVVAQPLLSRIGTKANLDFEVEKYLKGEQLIGLRYKPPFDYYYAEDGDETAPAKRPAGYPDVTSMRDLDRIDFYREHELPLESTDWPVEWRVVPATFITMEDGTGLVHIAPAFGQDDFGILERERRVFGAGGSVPKLRNPVAPNGRFTDEVADFRGRWVKDCDKEIIRVLRSKGLLFHQEQYLHEYPFCWRAEEDPLIQYPRRSWFIRTTDFKGLMLDNNRHINWLPEHIKDGRFGKFLATNVDWALSRERFWGTPLPIWVCEETGHMEAIGSYAELLAKPGVAGLEVWEKAKAANPDLVDDLKVHKPYIDAITYDSPKAAGKRMKRVTEVIDCWFDSGAMPFAQWGFKGQSHGIERDRFLRQFPADFISEAIDQTRGWFYSQLAISTLLFGNEPMSLSEMLAKDEPEKNRLIQLAYEAANDAAKACEYAEILSSPQSSATIKPPKPPHPFRNCIVLGLMLGEDGQKMSKSKRNYREPGEIFDRYGADALRWYFFANQPPWTSIRYNEQSIKDSIPEFLLRLWNVYSFFVIYANIDGFDPAAELASGKIAAKAGQLTSDVLAGAKTYRPVRERSELDRWLLSELARTAAFVTEKMDAYDNFAACQKIIDFVDGLSNWYVRRSRDRFWSGEKTSPDKLDAYWTLYECLLTTSKLIAPFVPFLAEAFWQNLAVAPFGERAAESVHLCDFPTGVASSDSSSAGDELLGARMGLVREISSLGRAARMGASLKVRQPLAKVEVMLASEEHRGWLEEHAALIRDELNVKQVDFTQHADEYITYTVTPDFKRLGPRIGKQLPAVKQALGNADGGALLAEMKSASKVTLPVPGGDVVLEPDDIQIRLQAKPGWAAAQGSGSVVVLATELTPELIQEGIAKDLVRAIQDRRKEIGCEYTDRILVGLVVEGADMAPLEAAQALADTIRQETLAVDLQDFAIPGVEPIEIDVAGVKTLLYVKIDKAGK